MLPLLYVTAICTWKMPWRFTCQNWHVILRINGLTNSLRTHSSLDAGQRIILKECTSKKRIPYVYQIGWLLQFHTNHVTRILFPEWMETYWCETSKWHRKFAEPYRKRDPMVMHRFVFVYFIIQNTLYFWYCLDQVITRNVKIEIQVLEIQKKGNRQRILYVLKKYIGVFTS